MNTLGINGKNYNINIYYNNMNGFQPPEKLIKFKNDNISLSKRSQKLIRDAYNIKIVGKRKKQQKKIIMDQAKELRGNNKGFRNLKYAYRFLGKLYNQAAVTTNEAAQQSFIEAQEIKNELIEAIKKFRIEKLNEIPYVMTRERLMKLGRKEFIKILNDNIGTAKITLDITNEDGSISHLTFNQSNFNQIKNYLNELDEGEETFGSDVEWLNDFNIIEDITFDRVEKASGNKKVKPEFFKWLNKTPFDLSELGIFKVVNKENYLDNCLVKALKASDIEQKRIDACKGLMFNRGISICKLNKIADIIGVNIRLRRDNKKKQSLVYGSHKYEKEISIGVIDNHYFIVKDLDFTTYALKNYKELMNKHENYDDWRTIYQIKNVKGKDYEVRDEKRCTDSYRVVKFLYQNREEYLKPIGHDSEIFGTIFFDKGMEFLEETHETLEYDEDYALKLNIYDEEKEIKKKAKSDKFINCFFDFETTKTKKFNYHIKKEMEQLQQQYFHKKKPKYYFDKLASLKKKLWTTIHDPYMCCAVICFPNEKKCWRLCATGSYAGKDILTGICKLVKQKGVDKKIRMIAHNCGFDYRFMQKYLFADTQKTKGSGLMNAKGKFGYDNEYYTFEFKDSYKLITMPLRDFGKCFNLIQEKEVFPYTLYNNAQNIKDEYCPIEYAKNELGPDKYKLFVDNIKKLNLNVEIDGIEKFDVIAYAKYYCMIDCDVLMKGYNTFRKWCLEDEVIKIDVNSVWTIASLANKVLMKHGSFENVYQVGGRVRHFLQKCVVGGRCCTRDNKKWIVEEKIADLDAVSLYPSAFYRMDGFLKGKPKVLKPHECNHNFLKQQDGFFIKVKITDVKKKYHIPCMSFVDQKSGIRNWTNEMVGKISYIDKTTLEDWIKYQKIEFEILCGYYYNDGRNPTIRKIIKRIFDLRLKKKAEKNPIQVVYKLIMNSAYGKTILKPITTEEKVIKGEKEMKKFLDRNYASIIEYHKVYDDRMKAKPKYIFKLQKDIIEHFNNAPVGIECLSMSKRIMFEPMCLAEDMGINIYITDTDSMHIEYDKVKDLTKRFTELYGREMEGKQLGQLHVDFDLDGSDGEISSKKSIYLGKKCYIDILQAKDKKGKSLVGHHIRMKGIPNSTLYYTADALSNKETSEDKLWNMYKKLYENNKIDFDLLEGGKRVNFKFNGDMTIGYMKEFVRTLSFNSKKGSIHKVIETIAV